MDVRINNEIAIHIQGFDSRYLKNPITGEVKTVDVVTYGPLGDPKTVMTKEIRRVSAVLPLDECGDNIAYITAHKLWKTIEPQYEAWKAGNEIPENGTPFAAWDGVTKGQAEILKGMGLRTVEAVAEASDIVINKSGLPNALLIRDTAKKYLASASGSREAAKMTTLETENAALKGQMAELMEQMKLLMSDQTEKKRGRQRADAVEAAA